MWFEEFQDGRHGGHLGYWNRTILAILNFRNTPMPPIKSKLNQTVREQMWIDDLKVAAIVAILDIRMKPF